MAIGAQVFVPAHLIERIEPLVLQSRPSVAITYSGADAVVRRVRSLKQPSVVAVISDSQSLRKTARALLAPAIGRRHTLRELSVNGAHLRGIDLALCDSRAMRVVKGLQKVHYELVAADCIEQLRQRLS